MNISGCVQNIRYRNEENGYSIIEVKTDDSEIILVGEIISIDIGEYIVAEVEEIINKTYGRQYKIININKTFPKDEELIYNYLLSKDFKNIGETVARRLVDRFGKDLFDIAQNNPMLLKEVKGMTEKRIQSFTEAVELKKKEISIILYLKKFNLNNLQIKNIIEKFKDQTIEIVSKNPYKLALEIKGFAFPTCDEIANKLGILINNKDRYKALILYILNNSLKEGNVFLYLNELKDKMKENINEDFYDIDDTLTEMQIDNIIRVIIINDINDENLKDEKRDENKIRIYLYNQYKIEYELSKMLYDIKDNIQIITGGPGTGKTYNINLILKEYIDSGNQVILCAPTGRAAKRMMEMTHYEAKTIHRTLEFSKILGDDKGYMFNKNENNKLECDLLIVDEMSMVDENLMYHLVKAIDDNTKVLLVGDVDQLPSVSAGNVLYDMINSKLFNVKILTTIYRQEEGSHISINAHKVNNGEKINLNKNENDFMFVKRINEVQIKNDIATLVSVNIPKYFNIDYDKIQVLCASKKGECGTDSLNKILQEKINKKSCDKEEINIGKYILRLNDRVMQTVNNYDLSYVIYDENNIVCDKGFGIFNGDIGTITEINKLRDTITVKFDEKEVEYERDNFNDLSLAYAITVHKSQGSEYDVVVMPMIHKSIFLTNRKILYTAITRAKKCICFVGSENVFNQMVENKYEYKRNSALCDRFYIS